MQLDNIDLRLLRVFTAIADNGGFAGAQAELGLSASTLSIHLSNLETRLGTTLCHRGRGGFRLTEKGRDLQQSIRRLFLAVEDFHMDAAALKNKLSGELFIGVNDATLTDPRAPLTEAIRRFAARDGDVHVCLTIDRPAGLVRALLDDRLHAAIGVVPQKVTGISYTPLYDEKHSLFCGRRHPLHDRPDSKISDEDVASAALAGRGFELAGDLALTGAAAFAATVENMEALATLVLSGAYIGFMPEHYARLWVDKGDLRPIRPDRYAHALPIHLCLRDERHRSPVLEVFLDDLLAANDAFASLKLN